MTETSNNIKNLATVIAKSLDEKNAQDIQILNLNGLESAVSDYFIICTSKNSVHAKTLADFATETCRKELNDRPLNIEGMDMAEWILVDYFNVVIHIFSEEKRNFIKLGDLWADAKEENLLTSEN